MITKETFVTMVNAFDEYFNGEIYEALKTIGAQENNIDPIFDSMIDALDKEVDPKRLARDDDNTYDCGSYVCEWLFGEGEFQEVCKTAEELYDYIAARYESLKTA